MRVINIVTSTGEALQPAPLSLPRTLLPHPLSQQSAEAKPESIYALV